MSLTLGLKGDLEKREQTWPPGEDGDVTGARSDMSTQPRQELSRDPAAREGPSSGAREGLGWAGGSKHLRFHVARTGGTQRKGSRNTQTCLLPPGPCPGQQGHDDVTATGWCGAKRRKWKNLRTYCICEIPQGEVVLELSSSPKLGASSRIKWGR